MYNVSMIKVYTSPSCGSCRKVKKWFMDNGIPFIEKNIFGPTFSEKDIYDILSKTDNGTDDIISKRSKIIVDNKIDVDNMSIKQLVEFVAKNPSVMKRPIIVDDKRIVVGFNTDDIASFVPQAKRVADYACTLAACPLYVGCDHKRT